MASSNDTQDIAVPRTLASAGLPRRVRRTLERALSLFSEDMERNLVIAVSEFEEELFRLADRSGTTRGGAVLDYLQTLRTVRMSRHDLVPRFMQLLETGLANIRKPGVYAPMNTVVPVTQSVSFRNLSLVDQSVMDEGTVLYEIASRQESRSNLILHLLGQRLGVLAAAPAYDSDRNPLGPQALCRAIRHASESLNIQHEARLLFYRIFDRRVMAHCQALFEKLDELLVEEGVLPGLTYVPMRTRAAAMQDDDSSWLPQNETARTPANPAQAGGSSPQGQTQSYRDSPGQGGASDGSRNSAQGQAGQSYSRPQQDGQLQGGEQQVGGRQVGPQQVGQQQGGLFQGKLSSPGSQQRRHPGTATQVSSDDSLFGGSHMEGPHDHQPAIHEGNRPHTNWMGQPIPFAADIDEQKAYHNLQQLLSERRAENERQNPVPPSMRAEQSISTADLLSTLGRLDTDPAHGAAAPSVAEIKNTLLAQARQRSGKAMALAPSDNDTFDLLGLLYNHLHQEIRGDAPAALLVKRLQTTLLRVALQDHAFFVRPQHPARQLLSTVSETAAKWLADDDFDPQLLAPLQQAVTNVVKNYNGNVEVFEQSNKQLQTHVEAQVRRAETLERRHIEAARGKEKLEAAKLRSEATLQEVLGDASLPKFNRALLNQAWADVLTLTHLRHGEGSEEWNRQVDATRQIVSISADRGALGEDPALKTQIETALKQVGYHEDEADVIARRLSSQARDDDDGESRTELTMKLKARVRLGEDAQKAHKPDLPPRTPQEQECYEHIRLLPFGTWIEFVTNQQGDVVRRRMSWFSPVTGTALFVNQRGQRVGEHSLDSLARMMAKDQVRVVTMQRARLVDRAWNAAMNALRSLAGRRDDSGGDDIAVRSTPAMPLEEEPDDDTFVRSVPAAPADDALASDAPPSKGAAT